MGGVSGLVVSSCGGRQDSQKANAGGRAVQGARKGESRSGKIGLEGSRYGIMTVLLTSPPGLFPSLPLQQRKTWPTAHAGPCAEHPGLLDNSQLLSPNTGTMPISASRPVLSVVCKFLPRHSQSHCSDTDFQDCNAGMDDDAMATRPRCRPQFACSAASNR